MGRLGGLVMESLEGLVERGGHGHHPLLHRTSRTDPPVMENVEGLVECSGHGHRPLLHSTSRADALPSPSPALG